MDAINNADDRSKIEVQCWAVKLYCERATAFLDMARTRNEELHNRRRKEILAAAADCFARKGIHQTTMQEICEASRISAGALYRYFPTKDSIVVAFAEDERAETAEFIAHLTRSPNIVAALTDIVPQLIEGLTDAKYGRLTLEIGAEATRNRAVAAAFEENEAELRSALGDSLRRGQEAGHVIRDLDRDATVFLLMALFDGVAGHSAFAPALEKGRLVRAVERLLRHMLVAPGLGAQRGRKKTR